MFLIAHQKAKSPTQWPGSIWCNWLSVHRHIATRHQVQGQAGHAPMATALPGGYALRAAPMMPL
jgi:hypothetical protein